MSKNRVTDDRKQLLIRYKIDEKGCVSFIDPCCDEIPVCLFGKIMEAISNVEQNGIVELLIRSTLFCLILHPRNQHSDKNKYEIL